MEGFHEGKFNNKLGKIMEVFFQQGEQVAFRQIVRDGKHCSWYSIIYEESALMAICLAGIIAVGIERTLELFSLS